MLFRTSLNSPDDGTTLDLGESENGIIKMSIAKYHVTAATTSTTDTSPVITTAMTSTTSTSNAIETIDKRWRDDNRCGINYPLPDGTLAQCNPDGVYPCCSNHDWCGNTYDHCACAGCIDYREGMQC